MRPDPPADAAAAATARAAALWSELAGVYDRLEAHVAAGDWHEAAGLAPRLAALERTLGPVWAEIQAARAAADAPGALVETWTGLDVGITRLAERCAALGARAGAARAATARALAAARTGRAQTRGYAGAGAPAPRFTSRRV